jgi:hypothetical protein
MTMTLRRLALALIVLAPASLAAADTVINFDDLTFSDYDPVPDGYGSNAVGTPNITVGYRTFNPADNATIQPYMNLWNSGYGNLSKVAFASNNGYGSEITLTPDAGYEVRLSSFDLAGWPQSTQLAAFVRILDASGNVLADLGTNILINGTGPSHSTFSPLLSHGGAIRIQFGTNWNIGIDNISFSQ